jgi:FixJ family two-component response regulator
MNKYQEKNQPIYNILIVDDEQDVLDTIAEALIGPRYKITCELNPADALKQIETNCYDIVLTDLMMPEIGGMDLVNAIKEKNENTFVIVITGHATINSVIESIHLGVYDYVNKPIDHKKLQNLVFRATENISLKRRNLELQKKNTRILANLSLLIDISKIIYQVTDLQSVFKMVIDTITEYFNLSKSAILMEDVQTGKFKIVSMNNIEADIEKVEFELAQTINDTRLSKTSESIINIRNNELDIGHVKISAAKNGWLSLHPISFQDQVMGFLMVQSEQEDSFASTEIISMLNILASQTAPMMYSLKFGKQNKPILENNVVYRIRESIEKAREVLCPITFALIRLELNSPSGDSFSYRDMIHTAHSFILNHIEDTFDILWQSQDTALLIMPEVDYFNAEIFCKGLKKMARSEFKAKETGAGLALHYACLGYPEAGNTAQEITDHLWSKILHEMQATKFDRFEEKIVE